MHIGEIAKYYNSLSPDVRDRHREEYADMLENGVNWPHTLPFIQRVEGLTTAGPRQLFKDFFIQQNVGERIARLKKGLDAASCAVIDTFIHRALQLPECSEDLKGNVVYFGLQDTLCNFLRGHAETHIAALHAQKLPQYSSQYNYGQFNSNFEPSVFYFHHGLRGQSKSVLDYIKQRDFIDGGAWIGDSALVLAKNYAPRKIHSFEISPRTCAKYVEVMEANAISTEQYAIVNAALGERSGQIRYNDNAQAGNSLQRSGVNDCNMTTIDEYAAANGLDVGFIKLDLEGWGLQALKGAEATIRERLPVLSIGIYHTPEEFFQIKPWLESLTDQYAFTVEKHDTNYTCCVDTVLMAIPRSLIPAP